jgi:hypothetical protein
MFFCEACNKRNEWPGIIPMSTGPCEICGTVAACYDIPSSALPPAKSRPPRRETMAKTYYTLLKADEDGNPLTFFNDADALRYLLDNPEQDYGVEEFKDAAWLGANKDPNYWGDNVGVILRCEVVVPVPSGKFVLPS